MVLEISNSFCRLTGIDDPDVRSMVKQVLTYKNDIGAEKSRLFYQLNKAKNGGSKKQYYFLLGQLKKLEATETVCWFNDDVFPTGHLNIVVDVLNEYGTIFDTVDHRIKPDPYLILRWNNKPFEPRYYQRDMIELAKVNDRGVFEASVGSGKTIVMAYILKDIAVNTLIVVPSRGLTQQLYNDFECWFGSQNVEIVNAEKVRKTKKFKPIRICTIQSLASLQKNGELQKLVKDVDCLMYDEFHHSASKSATDLLTEIDHVHYRYGFTGTFMRNDGKTLDMWGFLSNPLYNYPPKKAIEDGFLTPLQVKIYDLDGKFSPKYQKEYNINYCQLPQFFEKVKCLVSEIGTNEQILILVSKKDRCGLIIHEYLETFGIINSYISGDDSKEVITETIQLFNDKRITVLIGTQVIGEGIDIKSTDHLLICQGGKSEVGIVQSVGRCVRLYPGKTIATVHDFNFLETKFMKKHLKRRIETYKEHFDAKINYVR
jgi:superfamily II DNA or RNA helicase